MQRKLRYEERGEKQNEMNHSPVSNHEMHTRLHGHWLVLAWIILLTLLLPASIFFIMTTSLYISDIQRVCSTSVCSPGQLTLANVHLLASLNISPHTYALFNIVLMISYSVVCLLLCLLVLRYKYNDWMGLLSLLLCALSLMCNPTMARFFIFRNDAVLYGLRSFAFLQVILIAWFYGLFPTGRFVPPAMRWILIVYTILMMSFYLFSTFLHLTPVFVLVGAFVLLYCCMAFVLLSQIYRYRYVSTLIERQQTKWIFFSLAIFFLEEIWAYTAAYLFPTSFVNLLSSATELIVLVLLILSVVMAILRYRLWDIDVIINRTLVYGSLTLSLVLLYLAFVFVLQSLLNPFTKHSDVAVIGSTLATALLFQPLRARIQHSIDRRFYRSKYDAARTLAAFGATLHEEMDLQELSNQLLTVVSETMQPTHVSLWLRPREQAEELAMPVQKNYTKSSKNTKEYEHAYEKSTFSEGTEYPTAR